MTDEIRLYDEGIEASTVPRVIFGNLMMMVWIGLGAVSCWFIHPTIAWVFLALAIILVYFVLRKLVCTNCYYYGKLCPIGWGKLSAWLFAPGDLRNFSACAGVKVAPFTYGLLTLVPLVLCVAAVVQEPAPARITVLILLLAVAAYSGSIGRKQSCTTCKMRLMCPGSAAPEG